MHGSGNVQHAKQRPALLFLFSFASTVSLGIHMCAVVTDLMLILTSVTHVMG